MIVFVGVLRWWWEKDLNLRRRKPADLQSALVDRLSIPPANIKCWLSATYRRRDSLLSLLCIPVLGFSAEVWNLRPPNRRKDNREKKPQACQKTACGGRSRVSRICSNMSAAPRIMQGPKLEARTLTDILTDSWPPAPATVLSPRSPPPVPSSSPCVTRTVRSMKF